MATTSRTASSTQTFEPVDSTIVYSPYIAPADSIGGTSKTPTSGVYINGTAGNDTLNGSLYADEIHGRAGNDIIYGNGGNDRLFGEDGNDHLEGGEGNDIVDGGTGDDYIVAGNGTDTFIGGAGSDTLAFGYSSTLSAGIVVNLGANYVSTGDTISGIENVVGSSFNDILSGDANDNRFNGEGGDDYLFGMAGNDNLNGGNGSDTLLGGDGNDLLDGGRGSDKLTGGTGADTFVIRTYDPQHDRYGVAIDAITDFMSGTDKIQISGSPSALLGTDNKLAFGAFEHETDSGYLRETHFSNLDWSDQLLYDYHTQTLYQILGDRSDGLSLDDVVALAHIKYDPSSGHLDSSDFLFV